MCNRSACKTEGPSAVSSDVTVPWLGATIWDWEGEGHYSINKPDKASLINLESIME